MVYREENRIQHRRNGGMPPFFGPMVFWADGDIPRVRIAPLGDRAILDRFCRPVSGFDLEDPLPWNR